MIKLQNVSKYYYSKGIIASGLSGVSLELNFGEFVVITGESGSGKTTLLNVISGLDSYEEGELFIDGVETSHYTSRDFEEYRKKYIGNIFQDFNLINSYTVYQNIELALLIKGSRKKDVKDKIYSIIEKVGLHEYKNTKCSKLSGGQKQRVAIARALAKETPVIVADEPTGNLDSASAEGIVSLLKEISKDKLVIVVTHNYEQFENHATRIIKLNDGRIAEDRIIKDAVSNEFTAVSGAENISAGNQFRLGVRNAFNVIPKFLLLLFVFAFVVISVTSTYTSFKSQSDEVDKYGYNEFFQNYSEDRIVVKKADNSVITNEEFEELAKLENVKSVEKNDMVLDSELYIENETISFYGFPRDAEGFDGKVDMGRVPEKDNEVLIECYKDYTFLNSDPESVLDNEYKINLMSEDENSEAIKVKIVGIKYLDEANMYSSGDIYLTEKLMNKVKENTYKSYSESKVTINEKVYSSEDSAYRIVPNSKVPKGEAYVPEEINYLYKSENALNYKINVEIDNIYFNSEMDALIKKIYTKKTFEELTGNKDFDIHNGEIYVNKKEYNDLYKKGYYQSSVYVENVKDIEDTAADIEALGFKPFALKDHKVDYGEQEILNIIQIPFMILFIVAIFFIAYFVTRLILKSRGGYFVILRMLGLAKTNIKRILDIELCLVVSIAYALFIGLVVFIQTDIITVTYLKNIIDYLKFTDYIILYLLLLFMTLLISRRFAKKIFKKSAMVTFREEA